MKQKDGQDDRSDAEHLFESEECPILYFALNEHIDKFVSVGVDTGGVVEP